MKRYTKWLAFILCGALLLGGCGNAADDDKSKDKPDQTVDSDTTEPGDDSGSTSDPEPTPVPDDTTEPEVTPEPTEEPAEPTTTEAPVEESQIPSISIHPHHKTWYAEDQTTALLTVDDFSLYIESEGFSPLQASFSEQHPGIIEENYSEILSWATEHYTYSNDSFWGYSASRVAEWARCDGTVVSLRIVYSDYTGGAHGNYAYAGETYDVKTGKLLRLADIIKDVEGFYPLATDYIVDALYAEYEDALFSDYGNWVAESISPENEPNWYLTGSGIVISFSPYEVGPYAMGAPEITLPYEIFGEYMQEQYQLPAGVFVGQVHANQDLSYIVDASEPVYIESTMDEWGMEIVTICSGSVTFDAGQFSYTPDSYVTRHSNGRCFLLLSGDRMSGDYETNVYEITRGAIRECAKLNNTFVVSGTSTPNQWELGVRLDVLGTYSGNIMYNLSSTGEFTRTGDYYSINSNHALEIIKPLPVIIDNEETTLPVGEKIYVIGTNYEDTVYFEIEGTSQYGTIHFTREDGDWYPYIHINGLSETEYFKNLPYAG